MSEYNEPSENNHNNIYTSVSDVIDWYIYTAVANKLKPTSHQ